MKLTLTRRLLQETCTIGELSDGQGFECFTLELPVKDALPGSAVPAGVFPLANRVSPRFGRNVPHIDDIPERSNILIHWGNTPGDTEGCILVGKTFDLHNPCWIGESRKAFDELYARFTAALSAGEAVELEIVEQPGSTLQQTGT